MFAKAISQKNCKGVEVTEFSRHLQKISDKIKTIEPAEAIELHRLKEVCFVDLRDGFERLEHGTIPDAEHCPRGSLEFRIPRESEYHRSYFSKIKRFVFYCSHGQRSILATDTAGQMGLDDVCHIRGGMKAWIEAGGAVATHQDPGA